MDDLYSTPKSNLETEGDIDTSSRPGWVWVISIYYGISFLWTGLSFYLVTSGTFPLNEAKKSYFDHFTFVDAALMVVSVGIGLFAAVSLFMLKKVTVKAWAALTVYTIGSLAYTIATTEWLKVVGGPGAVGSIVGYALLVAIYFYTKRLDRRGYLK